MNITEDAVMNVLDSINAATDAAEMINIPTAARNKIENDIRAKADGYYGGNPGNGRVTTQAEQARIYERVICSSSDLI